MRCVLLVFLFLTTLKAAFGQQNQPDTSVAGDTVKTGYPRARPISVLDSVAQAMAVQNQQAADSLSLRYVKAPDPLRHSQLADTLLKMYLYKGYGFLDIRTRSKSILKEGKIRQTRDQWVIVIILALLVYTAVLNRTMHKDFESVWQSFYNKRMLTQVSKEDNLISSWAFLGLFVLFGLTFGLFLYQLAAYQHVFYSINGLQLFVWLSLIIITLFAVKFLLLKFIGFIFDINKLVSEYLSVLYLTYFNVAFVFLPLAVCFSLLGAPYIPYILIVALLFIIIILVWQYLRSSVNIISNILFHKFYLFIYLCALEICPILILIKALNI